MSKRQRDPLSTQPITKRPRFTVNPESFTPSQLLTSIQAKSDRFQSRIPSTIAFPQRRIVSKPIPKQTPKKVVKKTIKLPKLKEKEEQLTEKELKELTRVEQLHKLRKGSLIQKIIELEAQVRILLQK